MGASEIMTIGQLAQAVGKSPRALRLYEEKKLISPQGRSPGGFRLYGPDALSRIRSILHMGELGLPLSQIKKLIQEFKRASHGREAMDSLRNQYKKQLDEVDKQVERLKVLRNLIQSGLDYLEGCRGCMRSGQDGCQRCAGEFPDIVAGMFSQTQFGSRS